MHMSPFRRDMRAAQRLLTRSGRPTDGSSVVCPVVPPHTGKSKSRIQRPSGMESRFNRTCAKSKALLLGLFTPKVQAGNDVLARLVLVCVQNLRFAKGKQMSTVITRSKGLGSGGFQNEMLRGGGDHLSCARMQHPDILSSHDMDQLARLDVSYLYEARLEREDVGVAEGEGLGSTFPLYLPVRSCAPAIAIDEEAEVGVVEEEFAVETLDVDGTNVFFASDEIKGCVGLVEEGLTLSGLEGDNFKPFGTAHAES